MEKDKRKIFLNMLEEVLLKRVCDIKHLGKKSNYPLEKWEELFECIHGLVTIEENNDKPLPQLVSSILGFLYGVNIQTAIVLSEGIDQERKDQDFLLIKGLKHNVMALMAYTMNNDEDFQQVVLGGIYGFDKLRQRLAEKAEE